MINKKMKSKLEYLKIPSEIISKLNIQNINTIEELWCLKRKDLKKIGITDQEINQILINLQLEGLDLDNKKVKC